MSMRYSMEDARRKLGVGQLKTLHRWMLNEGITAKTDEHAADKRYKYLTAEDVTRLEEKYCKPSGDTLEERVRVLETELSALREEVAALRDMLQAR